MIQWITTWSNNSTSSIYAKELKAEIQTDSLYTNVHSSIIHSSRKVERTQMSMDRGLDKRIEYFSALKKN